MIPRITQVVLVIHTAFVAYVLCAYRPLSVGIALACVFALIANTVTFIAFGVLRRKDKS